MSTSNALPQPASVDAHLSSFDSVPLFMRSLPSDGEENTTALDALQSLIHEDTPNEIARNFKEQGNEYYIGKRFREALSYYNQAINAKPDDPQLLQALLGNRAACNLELKNYGSVLKDCATNISFNPKASKAYYRSARALIALERYDQAADTCVRCLTFDPGNAALLSLHEKASQLQASAEEKIKAKLELKRAEEGEKLRLKSSLMERNIIIRDDMSLSSSSTKPHFNKAIAGAVIFPVFFLYPQYATSDLISEYAEDTAFSAHLSAMFPPHTNHPDWDKSKEYIASNLVVFAITQRKRLLKVGKRMTLRDVCAKAGTDAEGNRDGLEMRDGCLSFSVLLKGDVETGWIEEFKRGRD